MRVQIRGHRWVGPFPSDFIQSKMGEQCYEVDEKEIAPQDSKTRKFTERWIEQSVESVVIAAKQDAPPTTPERPSARQSIDDTLETSHSPFSGPLRPWILVRLSYWIHIRSTS